MARIPGARRGNQFRYPFRVIGRRGRPFAQSNCGKKQVAGDELRKQLEVRGILVRCASNAELAEEASLAYKNVERVVDVVVQAGVARKVARFAPRGVLRA